MVLQLLSLRQRLGDESSVLWEIVAGRIAVECACLIMAVEASLAFSFLWLSREFATRDVDREKYILAVES